VKIGVLSKSTVLEPMRYDARALTKEAKEEYELNNIAHLSSRYLSSILSNFLH
jgi:hypothetical protein